MSHARCTERGALRRYNLAELDRMRSAINLIHSGGVERWYVVGSPQDDQRMTYDCKRVEEELRTSMIAGIDPAELEAKAEDIKLRRVEEQEESRRVFMKNQQEHRLRTEYGPRE